jgi:hypothetical protein
MDTDCDCGDDEDNVWSPDDGMAWHGFIVSFREAESPTSGRCKLCIATTGVNAAATDTVGNNDTACRRHL